MPIVNLRENDSFDVALRRFKRSCEKAGILSKLRQIEYHEKRTTKRKREAAAAEKREKKRLKKEQEVLERNRGRRFNFDTMVTSDAPKTATPIVAEKAVAEEVIAKEATAKEPGSEATKSDESPTTE